MSTLHLVKCNDNSSFLVLRQLYVLMSEYKTCSPLVNLMYHFRDNFDCISLGSHVLLFFFINGNGNENDVKTLVRSNGIVALIGTLQHLIDSDHIVETSTIELLSLIYYLCQFGMYYLQFIYKIICYYLNEIIQ